MENKRKRKFYNMALDPNFQVGMCSTQTQTSWENKYKSCLPEDKGESYFINFVY